jgi:hypothetical protein
VREYGCDALGGGYEKLLRAWTSQPQWDGSLLPPAAVSESWSGGVIMGLGLALMEASRFDERNGRILNPSQGPLD